MKKLVLAFILLLSAHSFLYAQNEQPRDILKTSLRKMSEGKVMTSFELQITFESLGQTVADPFHADAAKDLMEEIMKAAPDSMKKQLEISMKEASSRLSASMTEMYQGNIKQVKVDFKSDKAVSIGLRNNSLRGSMDTSRYVLDRAKTKMADLLTENPIALLQVLTADTTELHYTGISLVNDEENHVIQARTGSGWLDIYIEKKSGLVTQIARSHIDNDPLIGSKPEHYQDFTKYLNYQKTDGFLLPRIVEEISTRINVDVKYRLEWVSINKRLDENTFAPEPTYEEKTRFKVFPLRDSLFVIRQFGNGSEAQSLVRITGQGTLDLFMEPINHEAIAEKFVETLIAKFPERRFGNVFCSAHVSWISAFAPFFRHGAHVFTPKGNGMMSEEREHLYNKTEDSTWKARKAEGVLTIYEQSFSKNGVSIFVMNPGVKDEWDQLHVFYYLPKQKLIYYKGIHSESATGSRTVYPVEKRLYDFISSEKLDVKHLIITNSFIENPPLEISFADFERRMKRSVNPK
ncbi:hypothetical protein FEN17_11490 [Dyadobacter luticola]|uniref:DUF4252 domain-containing protein n=2 Tax=Dyadobacter luticola TaxID=1979387 RepID=A0A5R9KV18_9BACT|nr:hypothetical protein FEN17_11490 [Dyadobacter luticola]